MALYYSPIPERKSLIVFYLSITHQKVDFKITLSTYAQTKLQLFSHDMNWNRYPSQTHEFGFDKSD